MASTLLRKEDELDRNAKTYCEGMHIGVYLGSDVPEVGGGFTIQHDILEALFALHRETRHRFTVFGEQTQERISAPEGVALCDLPRREQPKKETRPKRMWRRLIGRPSPQTPKHSERVHELLTSHEIDVVWGLSQGTPAFDIPFVTIVWDLQHRLQPFFPEVSVDGQWISRERHYSESLRRAMAVITGTEAGRSEIERFYGVPRERIHILPHPTPRFALIAGDEDGEPARDRFALAVPYLFYPAQFWPHKNHVCVLEAIRSIRENRGIDLHVAFVGSDYGNENYVHSAAQRLGVADLVRFLGFVSRDELISLYRGALALVYPSYFGPENLPPLEAFALGCPVIAARVPGAEEQLGDAAILADPADADGFATAIIRLAEDSVLVADLKRKGAQRARRFTAVEFVRKMWSVFDRLEPRRRCWSTADPLTASE